MVFEPLQQVSLFAADFDLVATAKLLQNVDRTITTKYVTNISFALLSARGDTYT